MKRKQTIYILLIVVGLSGIVYLKQNFNTDSNLATNTLAEVKGNQEEKPNDWFYDQRVLPYGALNNDLYRRTLEQARSMFRKPRRVFEADWEFAGPTNIGGRIVDIEMHPDDQKTMYIAAASGGVFKSTDLGMSFKPIFDDALSLSTGDMAIAPSDPKILYVGTGEPNGGGGSITFDGLGVYKSTDEGKTWENVGLENVGSIGKVLVHPTNPDIVYVSAMGQLFGEGPNRGVYRSKDGGKTWEKVLFVAENTGSMDIVLNPKDPNILYASMWQRIRKPGVKIYGGKNTAIYKTTDGGDKWEKLEGGLPASSSNNGRIQLALCDAKPDVLYASIIHTNGGLIGVYKTTDAGQKWTRTNDGAVRGIFSTYGWWFGGISLDPSNENTVFVMGLTTYKSSDGGNSWNQINRSAHVDNHVTYVHPKNSRIVLIGNDGGLYVSTDGASSFTKRNTLPINQFYAVEIDATDPKRIYGGMQDNGTARTLTGNLNDFRGIYGGDGFYCLVDPTNNQYVYAESQYGAFGRSTNGGSSFSSALSGVNSSRKNWSTPVVFDPKNSSTLYLGAEKLYKSTNRAQSWTAISQDLTKGKNGSLGTITTIDVSPVDSKIIYVGTDDGNVSVTTDGGGSWKKITDGLPAHWVTRVVADLKDKNKVYVCFSGYRYNEYVAHVLVSENQGSTWKDISNNLPEAPANDLIIDPEREGFLYLATDVGVYFTTDNGEEWMVLGNGLPGCPTLDLDYHHGTKTLLAGTFGRSMYKFDLGINVSVKEGLAVEKSKIIIKSNPTTDFLRINLKVVGEEKGELVLHDLSGKIVQRMFAGTLSNIEREFTKNVSRFGSGTYILSWTTQKGRITEKLLIQ